MASNFVFGCFKTGHMAAQERRHLHHVNTDTAAGTDHDHQIAGRDTRPGLAHVQRCGDGIRNGGGLRRPDRIGNGDRISRRQNNERRIAAVSVDAHPAGKIGAQRVLTLCARLARAADEVEVRHHALPDAWRRDASADRFDPSDDLVAGDSG